MPGPSYFLRAIFSQEEPSTPHGTKAVEGRESFDGTESNSTFLYVLLMTDSPMWK